MSELPGFDQATPSVEFAQDKGNSVHIRKEGAQRDSKIRCESCGKVCGSKAGLASHVRAQHEMGLNELLDQDVVIVYAKATMDRSAIYSSDMDCWVAPIAFTVPKGFVIYDINPKVVAMMGDMKSYNTYKVTLVREGKMHG